MAKESPWASTSQDMRTRKKVQLTLSDEARTKLQDLTKNRGERMQSQIVEELVLLKWSLTHASQTHLTELMASIVEDDMPDETRREQVALFAFANLALTEEWDGKPLSELMDLREACYRFVGLERE